MLYNSNSANPWDWPSIESVTEYTYAISCPNSIGESERSESRSITSWPEDEDVTKTKIISLYPNPLHRPGISRFNLLIDYGSDMDDVDIQIFDIKGREILFRNFKQRCN